ncbi:DinB family protein [Actinopolymorpha sp. B11F2]|uniref:DinB family protein n=1 Tax=Actinopolymorpha sp. B11F2 TaxID=3160862 RepID=UPI0032E510FD
MPTPSETRTLISYLDAQREHVLGILEGLDDQALRRPVLPSAWTCLGLVHHLAHDVERGWFRAVIAGETDVIETLHSDIENAWQVTADTPAKDVLDNYREEAERANTILAVTSLDAAPAWWPQGQFGDWRLDTVREVVQHVMVETACHAGHLDAVRELIDGRRWLVLT